MQATYYTCNDNFDRFVSFMLSDWTAKVSGSGHKTYVGSCPDHFPVLAVQTSRENWPDHGMTYA